MNSGVMISCRLGSEGLHHQLRRCFHLPQINSLKAFRGLTHGLGFEASEFNASDWCLRVRVPDLGTSRTYAGLEPKDLRFRFRDAGVLGFEFRNMRSRVQGCCAVSRLTP